MRIMVRVVHIEWEPTWWANATAAQITRAVEVLRGNGATGIVVGKALYFMLQVHALDSLGVCDAVLSQIQHQVEELG